MQFHAIPCIIANVTKKHVSEDDIMFTFGSGVKGLTLTKQLLDVLLEYLRKQWYFRIEMYLALPYRLNFL